MATLTLNIKTPNADASVFAASGSGSKQICLSQAAALVKGLASGTKRGSVNVQVSATDPVAAAGTVTITHANVTNADTVTIGGVVITAATSGNGTTSWTIGADATADAAAFAACVNANTTLSKHVLASSALGVLTLTVKLKGSIGNLIVMSTSDATAFALVQLAGGTGGPEGTATVYG